MKKTGFSLLECMLGLFLLVLLILMTNAYIMTFIRTNQSIKNLSTATSLGQAKLEDLRLKPYNAIVSGIDTVKVKFIRSWTVVDKGGFKEIVVTIIWQKHKIKVATIIAK